ncbi:hypothetical protein, conserved in T. vivax [Trypanosoma vivax Y486]|uniref:Uncharacterized protein n=1 Tax=Trypanosoma vivax (strain Y486) TaxID=1055687 RepID=F9WP66_TRYVY|nr:hypothetical protein, conserved in T. vivax [Trypanosoma vivax Y486]|eukprot:CCD19340.1 hypothetical protein, conserved in T. vivax [Trypanosoma vivax Y486]
MAALRTRRNDAQPGSRKQVNQRDSKGKTIHPKTNTGKPRAAAMHTQTIDTGNTTARKERIVFEGHAGTSLAATLRSEGTEPANCRWRLWAHLLRNASRDRLRGRVGTKDNTECRTQQHTQTETHARGRNGWQQKPHASRPACFDGTGGRTAAAQGMAANFRGAMRRHARHRIAQGRSCAQTTDRNKQGKTTATPLGWRHGKQGTSENGACSNSGSETVSGETKTQDTVGETEHTGCATTGEQGGKQVTKRKLEARLRRTVFWKAAPKKKRHTAGTRTK